MALVFQLFGAILALQNEPPKFNKNQHKTDFERVQEGSENTGHMQVILEGVQDRFLVAEAAPGRLGDGFWKAPGAIQDARGEVSKPIFGSCFGKADLNGENRPGGMREAIESKIK